MSKGSPSQPAQPDPQAAARAQAAADIQTAIAQGYMNRVNQFGPTGSSVFTKIGTERVGEHDVPLFEQEISLTPGQQRLLNQQEGIGGELLDIASNQLGLIRNNLSQPLSFSGLPLTLSQATAGEVPQGQPYGVSTGNLPQTNQQGIWSSPMTNAAPGTFGQDHLRSGDDIGNFHMTNSNGGGYTAQQLLNLNVLPWISRDAAEFANFGLPQEQTTTETVPGTPGTPAGSPQFVKDANQARALGLPHIYDNLHLYKGYDDENSEHAGWIYTPEATPAVADTTRDVTTPGASDQDIIDLLNSNSEFRNAVAARYNLGTGPVGGTGSGSGSSPPITYAPPEEFLQGDPLLNPRDRVEEALYERMTSRLDPRFAQQRERREDALINAGFSRGGEAFNQAIDEFNRQENDAYGNAMRDAILAGGAEESRESALRMAERQQAITELLTKRSQPLNELAALTGQAPGVSMPQFAGPPQVGLNSPDVIGAIYNSAALGNQAFQQSQATSAANRGALFGLLGTLGGGALASPWLGNFSSDPDVKTEVRPLSGDELLDKFRSIPIEEWEYKDEPGVKRVGPYADDFAQEFGGDGHTIKMPVAFGVTMGAVQALADKVAKLEEKR